MARTVLRRRRDGVVAIRRTVRWRSVWIATAAIAAGAAVVLPLVLSLVVVLPAVVFSLPPMALGLGTWVLFRRLEALPAAAPPETCARVVPLRPRPRALAPPARPRGSSPPP